MEVSVQVPVPTTAKVSLVRADPATVGFGKSGTTYKQD
jgi:hypothetical protein